jgi:hypothetical protein
MKVIAVERAVRDAVAPSAELLEEEAAEVWRLYMERSVRQAWFTTGAHEVVLELECLD